MSIINIVIIDSQNQDREELTALVSAQNEINVLAYGYDGYDALKLIGSLKPDIVIVNNHLEYIEGEEVPPLIKARSPLTAVVILVSTISDIRLYRAASNKVSAIVHKETDMDILPRILRYVSDGGCFISPFFTFRVMQLLMGKKENDAFQIPDRKAASRPLIPFPDMKYIPGKDPASYLTKNELRVITLIGEGLTSDEIAGRLGLAVGTIRNNVSSVMRKTGLCSRSQIACYAFNSGLVPINHAALLPYLKNTHTI